MYTQMPQWGQALQSNTWQQPQGNQLQPGVQQPTQSQLAQAWQARQAENGTPQIAMAAGQGTNGPLPYDPTRQVDYLPGYAPSQGGAAPPFGYSPSPLSQFGWQSMMGGIAPWLQRYMPQQGMPQQAAAPAQQNDRFMRKWNRNPNQTVERFVNDQRFGQQVRNDPQQMQAMWGLLNNRPPPGTQAYVQRPEGGWQSSWADYLHMPAPQAAAPAQGIAPTAPPFAY